jgi:hypothetical protein
LKEEIKTYEWTCDKCGRPIIIQGEGRPIGWGEDSYTCGSDYCDGHQRDLCGWCTREGVRSENH